MTAKDSHQTAAETASQDRFRRVERAVEHFLRLDRRLMMLLDDVTRVIATLLRYSKVPFFYRTLDIVLTLFIYSNNKLGEMKGS